MADDLPGAAPPERDRVDTMIVTARIAIALWLVGALVGGYAILGLIGRNQKAIRVSCTLIANVATEAGAAGGREGTSLAARKQQEITALAFDVIIRQMTQAQRERFARLQAELAAAGGFVALPNCEQVSEDPESVKQLGSPVKQAKP